MKLKNCNLDFDRVVMRPPLKTSPHPDWESAREKGIIPENVFRFYCCADYFSLDKIPKFLDDENRIMFSFLQNVLEGVRHAFEEANELIKIIREAQGKGYSPLKRIRGEAWDPHADERQTRSMRFLIVILFGALDQLSEVASIFFHGFIPELTVGRASFAVLQKFARTPYIHHSSIITPKEHRCEELHTVLAEVTESSGPEKQWFELLKLYRNKLAHLGTSMFPILRLHDDKGNFYSFLPNRFPIFHESQLTFSKKKKSEDEQGSTRNYAEDYHIHQDIVEYSEKLLERVFFVINRCFNVLCTTYIDFRSFDLNDCALRSLKDKETKYEFKHFE